MTNPPPDPIVVDARGYRCPAPTLRLRKALQAAAPGQTVRLLADDPLARIDVPAFVAEIGYQIVNAGLTDDILSFDVRKPAR